MFTRSECVEVLLDEDCTKDITGGTTFLQTYWATFHGFIVQEDGERRQYLPMNRRFESMARLFLTARNAAVFFVHGPGRRLSTHDFWQFVRTFPVDLQWEVCLELGEERLVLCVVPTATAEVRVSGCLMRPPFEDVMLSLLSLSFPLRQELLQHLELQDLAFLVSTCSELHDVVMNQKSWEIEHTAYLKSLPSQILFAAAPTYRLYPTAYASTLNPEHVRLPAQRYSDRVCEHVLVQHLRCGGPKHLLLYLRSSIPLRMQNSYYMVGVETAAGSCFMSFSCLYSICPRV